MRKSSKLTVLVIFLLFAGLEQAGQLYSLISLKQPQKTKRKYSWLHVTPSALVFDSYARFFTDLEFEIYYSNETVKVNENSNYSKNDLERILMRRLHLYNSKDRMYDMVVKYFLCDNKYYQPNQLKFLEKKPVYITFKLKNLATQQIIEERFNCEN